MRRQKSFYKAIKPLNSLLDIYPAPKNLNYLEDPDIDALMLYRDWVRIGKDLYKAYEQQTREIEKAEISPNAFTKSATNNKQFVEDSM